MAQEKKVNPRDLVYTPQQIVTIGQEYLEYKRANRGGGIPLYLKSLDADDFFIPAFPGELITVIARPGNGKTGFMMRWARERAQDLMRQGVTDRVVVYITLEQSIEEMHAFNVAADKRLSATNMARGEITDAEWEAIMESGARRIELPLWLIGHSLKRRKRRPTLHISAIASALDYIEKWNDERTQIDMVFMDYLQRVPFEGSVESKTIGTSNVLDRCKDGALVFGCPFVVGCQAKADIDSRQLPIPDLNSGQWTSNVEQASDKIFGLVRPRVYKKEGEFFGKMEVRGHTQMLVSLIKQKLGPANVAKWVYFAPEYNKLDELEVKYADLNGTW